MRGKPILALFFVAIMAIVLTIPLRGTTGERRERAADVTETTPTPREEDTPTPEPTPTDEPTPTTEPTPTETPEPPDENETGRFRLAGNYPDRCLTPAPEPEGDGLLAVARGDGIRISDLSGNSSRRVDGRAPFKWSPSGRYLMTGSGTVYNARGKEIASLFEGDLFSWSWSPIADCVVFASQEGGVSVFVPGSGTRRLGDGVLSRFSFSPDGRGLAYVDAGGEPRLSRVRLTGGRPRTLVRPELSGDEEIVLAGWTPGGTYVLFWQGSPDALLKRGRALSAVPASGGDVSRAGGRVLAHRDFLTPCGDDLYAIVGGGARTQPGNKRLARITVGGATDYLTPEAANDLSPTCSPQADLLAVARASRANGRGARELTVIDTAGSVQFTPQQGGFDDAYPLWGRTDEGLLFIRRPNGGGAPQVWRVSETIPASATGVTLPIGGNPEASRDSWGRVLDWSADEPGGVSVLSGSDS